MSPVTDLISIAMARTHLRRLPYSANWQVNCLSMEEEVSSSFIQHEFSNGKYGMKAYHEGRAWHDKFHIFPTYAPISINNLTGIECYLMFNHLSFLMLKCSISRRIMIIPISVLLINISFEILLAQGLPIFILPNFNSYEMFVKQSLEN